MSESNSTKIPTGVAKKLLAVMAAVGWVEKSGTNQAQRYKYVEEAEVIAAARKAMVDNKLVLIPSCTSRTYSEVVSNQGNKGHIAHVMMQYSLVDAETGECVQFDIPGDGQDYGDKGIYKAITGANKYALLKLLQMPTGDDPENDSKEYNQPQQKPPAPPQPPVKEPPKPAQERPPVVPPTPPPVKTSPQATQPTTTAPDLRPSVNANILPLWKSLGEYAGAHISDVPTKILLGFAEHLTILVKKPTTPATVKFIPDYQKQVDAVIMVLELRGRTDNDMVAQAQSGQENQALQNEEEVLEPSDVPSALDSAPPSTGLVGIEAIKYQEQYDKLKACKTFRDAFETLNKAINDPVVQAQPKLKQLLEKLFNEEIGPGIRNQKK